MPTYYVTTSGNDANTGLTEALAVASPGRASALAILSGDIIYVKSGTYTISSSTSNANGGRVTLTQGVKMEGYQTTVGDQAARPVLQASIGSITLVSMPCSYNVRPCALVNIEIDGNSGASNKGVVVSTQYVVNIFNCIARNCPGDGFTGVAGGGLVIDRCSAYSCGNGFKDFYAATKCVAQANTGKGFVSVVNPSFCRSSGNTGIGFDLSNALGFLAKNCVSHGNGSHGFSATYDIGSIINCIATSNGTSGTVWGLSHSSATNGLTLINFAHRANFTGGIANVPVNAINTIALTADPYTAVGSNNFSISPTAADVALLRSLQRTAPGDAGIGYQDVGAYQHQDPSGGSSQSASGFIF